jgi:cytochrome P450
MRALLSTEQGLSPFAWYRAMRESTPVCYDADGGYWQLFLYDDVLRIATDHATFSSEGRRSMVAEEDHDLILPSIITMDPPRHRQFRNLVSQAFTPRAVAQLGPRIRAITNELLDRVIPTGAIDVMDDLASPLPVTVIAELLGIPVEDRPRFKHWSDALLAEDGEVATTEQAVQGIRGFRDRGRRLAARRAAHEMQEYFAPILATRRHHPQSDLISGLLAAEVDGARLTEDELLGFCVLLLVAGNITTTNLLGNAMVCFDEYPDALACLRQEPALIPSAVEEVLRYRPPAKMLVRIAATDTTIEDQWVTKGQVIVAWIASANRDDARFSNPEQFDVRREPNPHLTFGHGIHFCIGAPLARLEATIALQTMLERLPRLRRVPGLPLVWIGSPVLAGVQHFPITFDGS